MNLKPIRQILIDKEGWCRKAYKDSEDIWHIGCGHNLKEAQSDRELEILGLDDDLNDWSEFKITDKQIEELLQHDMEETLHRLSRSFTNEELQELDDSRFLAIYMMAYQIGSVSGFPAFVQAVKDKDYERAADEMLWRDGLKKKVRSRWYKQTQARCEYAASAMRRGITKHNDIELDEGYQPPGAQDASKELHTIVCDNNELLKDVLKQLTTLVDILRDG